MNYWNIRPAFIIYKNVYPFQFYSMSYATDSNAPLSHFILGSETNHVHVTLTGMRSSFLRLPSHFPPYTVMQVTVVKILYTCFSLLIN